MRNGLAAERWRSRLPLLAPGMLALLAGVWGGLLRLGWSLPAPSAGLAAYHGPLMVSGFLGTVIGLERAVALGARWPYLGPLATGLGGIALMAGVPGNLGPILATLGAAVLCLVFAVLVRRQTTLFTTTMALGALAWLVGNALWLAGWPVYRVVVWWAGFLALTIAGERLELARLLRLGAAARATFVLIVVALLGALVLTARAPDTGVRMAGAAMASLGIWLGLFDMARRTVRQSGLTRFIAIALLAGYVWLAVAGILVLHAGALAAGPTYDAILHAVFLGFVFSMIFAHAPIIFPAVLGLGVRYRSAFYGHVLLLHAALFIRMVGDLMLWEPGRRWGGLGNATAIALFLANTVGAMLPRPSSR